MIKIKRSNFNNLFSSRGLTYLIISSFILFWLAFSGPPLLQANCFAVVVGKKASSDGSILVGHNEQNRGRRIVNYRYVPRLKFPPGIKIKLKNGGTLEEVPQTFAFIWQENPGVEFGDSYFNEWGVVIVSDACPSREDSYEELVKRGEIRDGGIGYLLRRLVAQRARTAREGVKIAGELIERFGYTSMGRTYVIADPNEAWILAVVRGRHWIAERCPDDGVVLLPNLYIIGQEADLRIQIMSSHHLAWWTMPVGEAGITRLPANLLALKMYLPRRPGKIAFGKNTALTLGNGMPNPWSRANSLSCLMTVVFLSP